MLQMKKTQQTLPLDELPESAASQRNMETSWNQHQQRGKSTKRIVLMRKWKKMKLTVSNHLNRQVPTYAKKIIYLLKPLILF